MATYLTWTASLLLGGCGLLSLMSAQSTEMVNNPGSRDEGIDRIFAECNQPATPGASVAIVEHGKLVFEKAYGYANLEDAVPITAQTIFHVASVSKQFTAMAIVLLEQDGKLSLEDEVHKYLPELSDYGTPVTLRHLLQHTSGIRDQWQLLGLAGWDLRDVITQDQILHILFRQKELNFNPGSRWLYSNGGFTLLAEVVKRVSGKGLPEFCQERIFAPLGMTQTHFHLNVTEVVPHRALSYGRDGKNYELRPLNYSNVGATSLYTTATDLTKWLDNFRDPKVGGAKAIARMQEEGILTNGRKTGYALGLELGNYRGVRTVGHDGGDAGYRSTVIWFPDQEVGIVVVSNLGNFNTNQHAKKVADVFLAAALKEPARGADPVSVEHRETKINETIFDRYTGTYEFDERPGFKQKIWREGEHYFLQADQQPRFEIFPESDTKFFLREFEATLTFEANMEGKIDSFIQHQGGSEHRAHRYTPTVLNESDLAPYVGSYWSDELAAQYSFYLKNGVLFGYNLHHGEFALAFGKTDSFASQQWYAPKLSFTRAADGTVEGVTLGGGRVFGVHLTKKSPTPESH